MRLKAISVDDKRRAVRVTFANEVYPPQSVKAAANDFSGACNAKVVVFPKTISVELRPRQPMDLNVLGMEFANYALAKTRE